MEQKDLMQGQRHAEPVAFKVFVPNLGLGEREMTKGGKQEDVRPLDSQLETRIN